MQESSKHRDTRAEKETLPNITHESERHEIVAAPSQAESQRVLLKQKAKDEELTLGRVSTPGTIDNDYKLNSKTMMGYGSASKDNKMKIANESFTTY